MTQQMVRSQTQMEPKLVSFHGCCVSVIACCLFSQYLIRNCIDRIETGEENGDLTTIHIELGFFDGEYSDPDEAEVEALVCRTNAFLEEKIDEYAGDANIEVHATNIDWIPGENFSLAFAVQATSENGLPMATNEVYDALKLSDSDMQDYLVSYVIEPSSNDVFSQANEIFIKVNMGATLPQGRLEKAECQTSVFVEPEESSTNDVQPDAAPNRGSKSCYCCLLNVRNQVSISPSRFFLVTFNLPGVPASETEDSVAAPSSETEGSIVASAPAPGETLADDPSRVALESINSPVLDQVDKYNLIMGFFTTPVNQPTLVEVDSLMCEVKKFFTEYLRNQLGDPSLAVSLTNIGYSYNANDDCDAPMNVFFTIDATNSDGSSVDSNEIFHDLRLGEDEILDIIRNYVWASQPGTNIFRSVNQLTFESTLSGDPTSSHLPDGNIAEAICSIQGAPVPAQPNRNGTWAFSK